jgi:hypothetical protein
LGAFFLWDAVAAFPAATVVGRCGMAAANIVEPCGVHRWTLRRFLRQRFVGASLELAANIVGKIVGRCGNSRWRVVDQPLTHVRGQASLLFYGLLLQRICAPRFEQFDRHWREHGLICATVFCRAAVALGIKQPG